MIFTFRFKDGLNYDVTFLEKVHRFLAMQGIFENYHAGAFLKISIWWIFVYKSLTESKLINLTNLLIQR